MLYFFLAVDRNQKTKNSKTNAKHVFYLSAEFLMGRSLTNAVGNLKLEDAYGEAVKVRMSLVFFAVGKNSSHALSRATKTATSFPSHLSRSHLHTQTKNNSHLAMTSRPSLMPSRTPPWAMEVGSFAFFAFFQFSSSSSRPREKERKQTHLILFLSFHPPPPTPPHTPTPPPHHPTTHTPPGLGRLAACFLDSMATLDLPGWGYGIRYKYGMFKQALDSQGRQQELPDIWLTDGNPWEVRRDGVVSEVGYYGAVDPKTGKWNPGEVVLAQAYDTPIPGFGTKTMGNLRLWEALPSGGDLDLTAFNEGRFVDAAAAARRASEISAVLYPNDATEEGKELRLKQQYFFVSASLQDVLSRHAAGKRFWRDFSVFEREKEKKKRGGERKNTSTSTS